MWSESKTHLVEAGESYFEHLRFAAGVGLMLVAAGLACILHGLIPGCCTRTASRTVDELARLFRERNALGEILDAASGALTLIGLLVLTIPAWALALSAPGELPLAIAALALSIPATYLWTNPQLEPVD
jgi:uncharacterized protein YjeT (DUF2065 family)